MITKATTTINTKAWIRNIMISLSILLTGTHFESCNDDKDLSRKEYLIVSDTLVERQADIIRCALDNAEGEIYVFSNIDYKIDFKTNDKDRN